MHPNVYSSNVHNSQNIERAQMSIDRLMGKEEVVYIYNGILLSHQKDEVLPFATTWMKLEGIILSEISQSGFMFLMSSLRTNSLSSPRAPPNFFPQNV